MKTETEAKELWCPMVRDTDENMGTFNRWFEYEPRDPADPKKPRKQTDKLAKGCRCIASRCMMWRWDSPQTRRCPECLDGPRKQICSNCRGTGRIGEAVGYCGLGGKP